MSSPSGPPCWGASTCAASSRSCSATGPLSRADVMRRSGVSAPTVSKAVDALLGSGLLEEEEPDRPALGRPGRVLRLASRKARVLGVVLDAGRCAVLSAGLDGRIHEGSVRTFATPGSYRRLLDAVAEHASALAAGRGVATLGLGISMPGLIDRASGAGVLSPNLHVTDGRRPAADLAERLGIDCVVRQESHGLCLAENFWGEARGLADFAMLDVSTGLGLGVLSGGRLLEGSAGLAGELGHMTIDPRGRLCGCGNRGCLETFATDTSLARDVSRSLGREVDIDEVIRLCRAGKGRILEALHRTCESLAVAAGAVINIFNPSTLIVHGRLLEAQEGLFGTLVDLVRRRALAPSLNGCRILQARGSKRQGAVAAIVAHLLDSLAPALAWPAGPNN